MIELTIESIRVSLMNYQRVVILRDKSSDRYLPIWIGAAEADAIAVQLQDVTGAAVGTVEMTFPYVAGSDQEALVQKANDIKDELRRRISHGAEDTRGEPHFRYLAATLPDCEACVWPDVGHLGVLRHWREVLESVARS